MKAVVLVLFLLGGCSFLAARPNNDPRVGCTRTNARMDAGAALVAVAGIVVLIVRHGLESTGESDHSNRGLVTGLGVTALGVFSLFEAAQASYGFQVNERCRAERAKLASMPRILPGPPGATP